jgi:transposase-like protein
MKTIQPTLINYAEILTFYNLSRKIDPNIFLSPKGVIHTSRIECPLCGNLCSYNGSNESGHIISRSYGATFKIGQQFCSNCNKTYQVNTGFLNQIKTSLDKFILNTAISLREKHLSFQEISNHFKDAYHISISSSTIETTVNNKLLDLDDLELEYEIEDGFYGYDEQYLKVNGKRIYRIVIYDYKKNYPIYECEHQSLTKKILKSILIEVFGDNIPKGFVFDMRTMYPKAFKEVFGRKIKLQFCVFHLHKHILDEYKKALKSCNSVKFRLMDYRNMYGLFNVFYNRTQEIKLIEGFQKEFEMFKDLLSHSENITLYSTGIKSNKKCNSLEKKKEFLISMYEKSLMKKFRRFLKAEKNKRKRQKKTLIIRDIEDARSQLDLILSVKIIYPKKIKKIISKMNEEFELFTGSEGEILTNNKLEGFFGTTLKKFRKKGFQTREGLKNFFTFKKMKYLGKKIVEPLNLCDLSLVLGVIPLFRG